MPVSMEELLEQQWDQSARFLMEQSQHFDGGWVYVWAGWHVCVGVCASVCMHMRVCRHVCVCETEGVLLCVCVWVRERVCVCVCVTCLNKADSDPGSSWSKASTLIAGGQSQHFNSQHFDSGWAKPAL